MPSAAVQAKPRKVLKDHPGLSDRILLHRPQLCGLLRIHPGAHGICHCTGFLLLGWPPRH